MYLGPMDAVAPRGGTFGSFAGRPQGLRASIVPRPSAQRDEMFERSWSPQITFHHIRPRQVERRAKVLIVVFPKCRRDRDLRKRFYRELGAAAPFPVHGMDKVRNRTMPRTGPAPLELRSQQ